jgi:hypothetical protein
LNYELAEQSKDPREAGLRDRVRFDHLKQNGTYWRWSLSNNRPEQFTIASITPTPPSKLQNNQMSAFTGQSISAFKIKTQSNQKLVVYVNKSGDVVLNVPGSNRPTQALYLRYVDPPSYSTRRGGTRRRRRTGTLKRKNSK